MDSNSKNRGKFNWKEDAEELCGEELKKLFNRVKYTRDKNIMRQYVKYPDYVVRIGLAKNANLTKHFFKKLAKDESVKVREIIAGRTKNYATRRKFRKDLSPSVRKALVYNRHITRGELRNLVKDPDENISQIAKDRLK